MRLFLSVLLISLLALTPTVFTGGLDTEYKVKIAVMGTLLLLAAVYLCRWHTGKVAAGVISLLWGLNLSLSAFFREQTGADYIAGLPSLLSQRQSLYGSETLTENTGLAGFFLCASAAYFMAVRLLSRVTPRRAVRKAGLSLLLLSCILPVEYYAMEKDKTPGLTIYDHYLLGTPLYNLASVSMALRYRTNMSS